MQLISFNYYNSHYIHHSSRDNSTDLRTSGGFGVEKERVPTLSEDWQTEARPWSIEREGKTNAFGINEGRKASKKEGKKIHFLAASTMG